MYSDAADEKPAVRTVHEIAPHRASRWDHFPFSEISHHGAGCCDLAREWLVAMDFAQLNGANLASGPRWLRAKYEWGPSAWPIHWCEVASSKVIDCGAHSALAHEVFLARGLTAFRAQFVQSYNDEAVDQWRGRWAEDRASDHWLGDGVIYHEGNALLLEGSQVKLWDGSAGSWINPRQGSGYGSLVAVRIFAPNQPEELLQWGEHTLKPNVWQEIDPAPSALPANAVLLRSGGH
jgi:hypothetical protein